MKYRSLILILGIFIILSFATLPRNPLLNDDASTYALFTKNAILHNQWIVQFITPGDISSFYDKPPLSIWLLAFIPKIFGLSELSIHIPNVFYYCLILGLIYFPLSRLATRKIALFSTLISATSLALIVYSRAPKLDVPLTLFVLAAHIMLYAFLKNEKIIYLYLFTILLAGGFLVKTAFGIIIPGLTLLALFTFNSCARKKMLKFAFSLHFLFCLIILISIIGSFLGLQFLALKEYFISYLKSITIQPKYNVSSLGFGFHHALLGFLLIIIFPWTPLFFSSLKLKVFRQIKKLNLNTFCNYWFWSNFLFLLFFYPPIDFRHCTAFVPPMAILAAIKLLSLKEFPKKRLSPALWNLFFLVIFFAILTYLLIKPYNPEGIYVSYAIPPIALFVLALASLSIYFWKPSNIKFNAGFIFICLAYVTLFYNTKPLAKEFNPDTSWPALIKEYKTKGYAFYIYRPPDRSLIMSPDLAYVDFIAGPADKYFWEGDKLKVALKSKKALVLSDTASWQKLNQKGKILAQDSYSLITLTPALVKDISPSPKGRGEIM